MGKLLKFEFRKLFQMKSLYIFIAVLIAFMVMEVGAYKMLDILQDMTTTEIAVSGGSTDMSMSMELLGLSSERTGKYFLASALFNSEIIIALAVLVSLIFCSDNSQGTIKNIISKGYSRTKLFAAKFATSSVTAIIFTVVCWISGFLLGLIFWGEIGSDWNTKLLYTLFAQLITILAYCSMFALLALIIKKTAGVIALSIVVPVGLNLIISLVDLGIDSEKFKLANYWFGGNMTTLASTNCETDIITRSFIVAASYLAVFILLNTLLARKNDV